MRASCQARPSASSRSWIGVHQRQRVGRRPLAAAVRLAAPAPLASAGVETPTPRRRRRPRSSPPAAAVVLKAVIAMARTLARGIVKAAVAVAAAAVALLHPGTLGQLVTIVVAGLVGALLFRGRMRALPLTLGFRISRRTATACGAFFVLLFFVPLWLADVLSRRTACASSTPSTARVRSSSAAAMSCCRSSTRPWSLPAGCRSRHSWPATAPPRPSPVRCSRSRPTWVPSSIRRRTGLPEQGLRSSRSSCRRSCSSVQHCRSGRRRASGREIQAAVAGFGAAVVGLLAAALWDPVLSTSVHDSLDAAVRRAALRPAALLAAVGGRRDRRRGRCGPLLTSDSPDRGTLRQAGSSRASRNGAAR